MPARMEADRRVERSLPPGRGLEAVAWALSLFCGSLALIFLLAVFEFLIKVVWPDPLIYTWIAGGL